MAKPATYYFDCFVNLIDYSLKAAIELDSLLKNFKVETLHNDIAKVHTIEHEADLARHKVMKELMREFITPIEREDIVRTIQQIENVTDSIESVARRVYMFDFKYILEEAKAFSTLIVKCCEATRDMLVEFKDFRKSKVIHDHIVKVNDYEEQGDRLHLETLRKLYSSRGDAVHIEAWTRMLDKMEQCCDACEDVSEVVEDVMMKNT